MRDVARHSGSGPTFGKPRPLQWFSVIGYVDGLSWVTAYIAAPNRRLAEKAVRESKLSRCAKLERMSNAAIPDAMTRKPEAIHCRKMRWGDPNYRTASGRTSVVEAPEIHTL